MELFDDSEAKKHMKGVFDRSTMEALYDLADDGRLDVLKGFVKEGKESKVCIAEKDDRLIAAKIYMVAASNYRRMQDYLVGDPRFEGIRQNRRDVVFTWCSKEFKNLRKVRHAGIDAPAPLAFERNVLLMEFLGDGYQPAPRLEDVMLDNPATALDILLDAVETLWQEEDMVHADLSPYNVLVHAGRPYLIDLSQAVLRAHPRAEEFLQRDVETLLNHFRRKYDVDRDADEVVTRITA